MYSKLIYFEEFNNVSQFGYVRCHLPDSTSSFWDELIIEFNQMDIDDIMRT